MNFDASPDRRGQDSHKWNRYAKGSEDVIAAWLADTDFLAPPAVLDAVKTRLEGTALGYSEPPRELMEVFLARMQRHDGGGIDLPAI